MANVLTSPPGGKSFCPGERDGAPGRDAEVPYDCDKLTESPPIWHTGVKRAKNQREDYQRMVPEFLTRIERHGKLCILLWKDDYHAQSARG